MNSGRSPIRPAPAAAPERGPLFFGLFGLCVAYLAVLPLAWVTVDKIASAEGGTSAGMVSLMVFLHQDVTVALVLCAIAVVVLVLRHPLGRLAYRIRTFSWPYGAIP